MTSKLKLIIAFIICITFGISIGYVYVQVKPGLSQWFVGQSRLYFSSDEVLQKAYQTGVVINLTWAELIPDNEKAVLQKYQQTQARNPTEFTDNLLLSIEAASDEQYNAAMTSTNTVDTFDSKAVSIPGFIVPIDFQSESRLDNIFIVPYFGACIHFPPPPPNQIIFATLDGAFTDFDITQAYRINGIMRRGLFEDPLGTSAYIIEVVSIEAYFDNPDDFRTH